MPRRVAVAERKQDIAFRADDEIAPLPVGAGIAADVEAVGIDIADRDRCRPCPSRSRRARRDRSRSSCWPARPRRSRGAGKRLDVAEIGREGRSAPEAPWPRLRTGSKNASHKSPDDPDLAPPEMQAACVCSMPARSRRQFGVERAEIVAETKNFQRHRALQPHCLTTSRHERRGTSDMRARICAANVNGASDSAHERATTALVTGGARRIGAAIVRDLAAPRLGGRDPLQPVGRGGEALAAEIRAAGGRAAIVSRPTSPTRRRCARIVPEAAAALGPLTLLVNNASVFLKDRFGALDLARLADPIRRQPARAGVPRRGLRGAASRRTARATSST